MQWSGVHDKTSRKHHKTNIHNKLTSWFASMTTLLYETFFFLESDEMECLYNNDKIQNVAASSLDIIHCDKASAERNKLPSIAGNEKVQKSHDLLDTVAEGSVKSGYVCLSLHSSRQILRTSLELGHGSRRRNTSSKYDKDCAITSRCTRFSSF